jgi:hypothetical protein
MVASVNFRGHESAFQETVSVRRGIGALTLFKLAGLLVRHQISSSHEF